MINQIIPSFVCNHIILQMFLLKDRRQFAKVCVMTWWSVQLEHETREWWRQNTQSKNPATEAVKSSTKLELALVDGPHLLLHVFRGKAWKPLSFCILPEAFYLVPSSLLPQCTAGANEQDVPGSVSRKRRLLPVPASQAKPLCWDDHSTACAPQCPTTGCSASFWGKGFHLQG